MKKWFEYLEKNYKDPEYTPGSSALPIANVYSEMHHLFEYIKDIYETTQVTRHVSSNFSQKNGYIDTLTIPNLDQSTLEQWIYDPEFDDLLNLPSHETVYFHQEQDYNTLVDTFAQAMGFENFVKKKDLGAVKLHVQHPGQVFPLHFDRPQYKDFGMDIENLKQPPVHQRFLVFMEDIRPGQLFQMDHVTLSWKAGDVFTWDARNTMHGSANVGYWKRWMMMYTLQILP
jgi:hypothetical protein